MSGVGSSTISGTPSCFLSFPGAACLGRKSATAAAITTTSASARAVTASSICSAVSTGTTSTCGGAGSSTVLTSTTRAPRAAASDAIAYPCLPELRLAITRTASIGSRGPSGRDDHRRTGEVAGAEDPLGRGDDVDRVGEPAGTDVTAGQPSDRRLDDVDASAAQRLEVLDDGRVLPHLGVHRRAQQHRRPRGEQRVGEQVGGEARGVGTDDAGGGRCDDDEVGVLPEPGVRNRGRAVPQARSARARWRGH